VLFGPHKTKHSW